MNFPMISNAILLIGLLQEVYIMAANFGRCQMEMVRNLRFKKLTIKKLTVKNLRLKRKNIYSHIVFSLDI